MRRREFLGASLVSAAGLALAGAPAAAAALADRGARLAAVGYALPEEITVAKEDVHFRLPKEVARA